MTIDPLLHCPACGAQTPLTGYAPEQRVRCGGCRSILEVPVVDELLSPADRAILDARGAARAPSLRTPALLAAGILVVGLISGWILWRRIEAPPAPPSDAPAPPLDFQTLASQNRLLEYPLALGWSWSYEGGGLKEERRVTFRSLGPDGEPQFDIEIDGSAGRGRLTVRMSLQNALLVAETDATGRWQYEPPIPFLQFPLYDGDTWSYEGRRTREGQEGETLKLDFAASIDAIDAAYTGPIDAIKVTATGGRGLQLIEERTWYVKGVGIVQRSAGPATLVLTGAKLPGN